MENGKVSESEQFCWNDQIKTSCQSRLRTGKDARRVRVYVLEAMSTQRRFVRFSMNEKKTMKAMMSRYIRDIY